MKRSQLKIEELLDHLSQVDLDVDSVHRYSLRRELLCSRFFDEHCCRQATWNKIMTFTAPLVTGGVLVVVFLMVGSSLTDVENQPLERPFEPTVVVIENQVESKMSSTEFVDARSYLPLYESIQFVPVKMVDYVMMR